MKRKNFFIWQSCPIKHWKEIGAIIHVDEKKDFYFAHTCEGKKEVDYVDIDGDSSVVDVCLSTSGRWRRSKGDLKHALGLGPVQVWLIHKVLKVDGLKVDGLVKCVDH